VSESVHFGRMDAGLVGRLDREAERRGVERRAMVEAMLLAMMRQVDRGYRIMTVEELGSDQEVPGIVPGLRERVVGAAERCHVPVEVFVARALSSLLERVDNGWRGPVVLPKVSKPGFEGSKLPGHRDVPELGWYRPTSAEARGPDERASRLPD